MPTALTDGPPPPSRLKVIDPDDPGFDPKDRIPPPRKPPSEGVVRLIAQYPMAEEVDGSIVFFDKGTEFTISAERAKSLKTLCRHVFTKPDGSIGEKPIRDDLVPEPDATLLQGPMRLEPGLVAIDPIATPDVPLDPITKPDVMLDPITKPDVMLDPITKPDVAADKPV